MFNALLRGKSFGASYITSSAFSPVTDTARTKTDKIYIPGTDLPEQTEISRYISTFLQGYLKVEHNLIHS
jgi:hypothetical protein